MIIVSTQCFPPKRGGIENLIYNISYWLSKYKHEVIVMADGHSRPEDERFDAGEEFTVKRYYGFKPWRRRIKAAAINNYPAVDKPISLITDSWKSLEHLNPNHFSRVLCLAHGSELPEAPSAYKKHRIKSAFNKTNIIVANSHYTAGRCRQYVADPNKIHVVYPGINEPLPPPQDSLNKARDDLGNADPILISVARLEKRKGHYKIIDLLPQLLKKFPRLAYVIIGDGKEQPRLENLVSQNQLSRHVFFCPALTKNELIAYLSCSDIFVLPGSAEGDDVEGFGIAYLEAADYAIPAIAGNKGGAPEAVIDGETGLVCNARESESILKAVTRLLEDVELRQRLGKNAQQRAKQFYWSETIKKYETLLEPIS